MTNAFFKNSATYTISILLNGLIPFLLIPVLTRYLSVEGYGQIAIFQTLYWAISSFVGITVAGASDRKFFDYTPQHDLANFIGACFQVCLFLSMQTFFIFFIFQNQLADALETSPEYIFYAILVAISLSIIQIRLGQWQVRGQANIFGAFQVSQSVFLVILTLLLIVAFNFNEWGRILSQVLICSIFAFLSIIWLIKDKLLNFFSWHPEHLKDALKFSIPLIPHAVGIFLINMVDRLFIANYLGIEKAGVYMLAAQLAIILSLVPDAVNKAVQPWIFKNLTINKMKEKKAIVKFTYIWFVVILCFVPPLFLMGQSIVVFVAGPEYLNAGKVFGWLALGHAFAGMYVMLNCYIYFSKQTYILSIVTLISGLLNIALLIFLIQPFGIEGAGIAFSISMFFRLILTWIMAQKVYPMPWVAFMKRVPS